MSDRQLDLFAGGGSRPDTLRPTVVDRFRLTPAALDDDALIAAIPVSSLIDCHDLAAEAGRRGLKAAIPALVALCRRFKGFGTEHLIPEQAAALEGLAAIGGREAADAVARFIVEQVVQGPGLAHAVAIAARLGARMSREFAASLLRDPSPHVRAHACHFARPWPEVVALLIDLLDDLNGVVVAAAACALGRMGRTESRPYLVRLLHERPCVEVIEAMAPVADEECLTLLGRAAQGRSEAVEAVLAVLDDMDHPRAAMIAARIRGSSGATR
jgi:HEAT repeat protein